MHLKEMRWWLAAVLAWACCLVPVASAAQTSYMIGPRDVLAITVWDQADLTGKFAVETDGTISFPLIGRVKVAGLSLRELEVELAKRLGDGYIKNPQVGIVVEQYRSQRIFIVGEVRSPGTYPLTGGMTLIEALAGAGSVTTSASGEVLIVRPPLGRPITGPLLPNQEERSEMIRVDVDEIQKGKMSRNVALRDGDTIFVPRAEMIYVYGQVKTPGAYGIQKGTTVMQALALAGGLTERGSTRKMKVVRTVDGKKKETSVKMSDVVQPGDTLIVGERFF